MNNYKNILWHYKNTVLATLVVVLSTGNFSCKKIEDVESNRLASEANNWKKYEDARANLLSVYGLLRSATVSDNTHWLMGDLRQGDFKITNRADLKAIVDGQLNAQFPVINRITNWRRFYAAINAASLFIERSKEIVGLDPRYTQVQNNVEVAQARMVRAMAYFYMVRIWGDVPLLTTSHDGDFIQVPRTNKDIVLQFATSELLNAAEIVPFAYGGTDPIFPGTYYGQSTAAWVGTIFTRLSAYILLAHISAWQGNYLDASRYSKFVIDNYPTANARSTGAANIVLLSIDALTENLNYYSPFAFKRSTLLIGFPFEYGTGLATADGHLEQLTLAAPYIPKTRPEMFVSKDTILKAFTDPGDLRFSFDTKTNTYRKNYFTNFSSEEPVFSKIKVVYPSATSGNTVLFASSLVFSRLEEMILLYAEANAALGNLAQAVSVLNSYTENRGTTKYDPLVNGSSQIAVLKAIFAERRRELMGEGWRWYDLVRYNRIVKAPGIFIVKNGQPLTFRQFEEAGGIYWPVSQDVINANPKITQNPYWK
ncbi:RagB/SusD family nutrient uptake outer membrane protein [Pedobacter sp. MC2016-05]|uniref:RagB/SusD family nutrient uptake outer membrane protein n=1 Tax=Pedobacter sp. MC2016-05 TaxID=2994474 RepID=UPI00224652E7|nr:RagB/SusD family nutrient uptake outer membrane protein [Pedobacter sp. MC2016-05]MCX2473755.1 RagB/SusD family nutrient uptake outer membrane protein [Pedobacter sp. MC2016-05]